MNRVVSLAAALLGLALPDVTRACDTPTDSASLQASVAAAEKAYASLDTDGFRTATTTLQDALPCFAEAATPALAASVHRMQGLRAFVDRDYTRSKQAFAAARSVDPEYRFPSTLVPARHPLWAEYDAFPLEGALTVSVPGPAAGRLRIDGQDTATRAATWPALFQVLDDAGGAVLTTYLWPSDPLPDYPKLGTPLVVAPPPPSPPPARRPLLVAAGVSLAAAGALYGGAAVVAARWADPSLTPYDETPTLRRQVNGLTVASGATGVLAVGLGLGAAVVGRW